MYKAIQGVHVKGCRRFHWIHVSNCIVCGYDYTWVRLVGAVGTATVIVHRLEGERIASRDGQVPRGDRTAYGRASVIHLAPAVAGLCDNRPASPGRHRAVGYRPRNDRYQLHTRLLRRLKGTDD